MLRASKAISLFLVGSATALAGYEAIVPHDQNVLDGYSNSYSQGNSSPDGQGDFDSTTQPSGSRGTGYSGTNYSHTSYSHMGYSHFYPGRGYFGSGYRSSSGNYGTSSAHSGTSRGGFGSSGHAAGS